MVREMLSATFDVICDVALSGREHFDADVYRSALMRYFETAGRPRSSIFSKCQTGSRDLAALLATAR